MTIEERVHESLDNAIDNGVEILRWHDNTIAHDLIKHDADLEDLTEEQLLPHIASWRKKKETT